MTKRHHFGGKTDLAEKKVYIYMLICLFLLEQFFVVTQETLPISFSETLFSLIW